MGLNLYWLGIIPARAGFTNRVTPVPSSTRDHPRSRGVYRDVVLVGLGAHGSSPLARGLPGSAAVRSTQPGIIPARAGFTEVHDLKVEVERDHPRSRGVYVINLSCAIVTGGSSPLARGLLEGRRRRGRGLGIIPARAGFTAVGGGQAPGPRDHPRSRGVYKLRGSGKWAQNGSSPLARGLPAAEVEGGGQVGIIPARAGFTGEPAPPA